MVISFWWFDEQLEGMGLVADTATDADKLSRMCLCQPVWSTCSVSTSVLGGDVLQASRAVATGSFQKRYFFPQQCNSTFNSPAMRICFVRRLIVRKRHEGYGYRRPVLPPNVLTVRVALMQWLSYYSLNMPRFFFAVKTIYK